MREITKQRLAYICDSPNVYRNPIGKKILYALYDCTCGLVVEKNKADVTRNKVRSCNVCNGHGMTSSRVYRIWQAMKTRTTNPNYAEYHYYGGKGVRLCKRWHSFDNFYADMGKSYDEHLAEYGEKDTTIDRIDPNGHYEPSNCRWATIMEQVHNRSDYGDKHTRIFNKKGKEVNTLCCSPTLYSSLPSDDAQNLKTKEV